MKKACGNCRFYDFGREICTRDGSGHSGRHMDVDAPACEHMYKESFQGSLIREADERKERHAAEQERALSLTRSVDQLGQYLAQLGQMMAVMQRRMDEMEARQAAVTIRHADVKRLNQLIRMRAGQICDKYGLTDAESPKVFRAAIKKDVLKRYGVKDLHDLPAAGMAGAENMINGWVNIRLAMERRVST